MRIIVEFILVVFAGNLCWWRAPLGFVVIINSRVATKAVIMPSFLFLGLKVSVSLGASRFFRIRHILIFKRKTENKQKCPSSNKSRFFRMKLKERRLMTGKSPGLKTILGRFKTILGRFWRPSWSPRGAQRGHLGRAKHEFPASKTEVWLFLFIWRLYTHV